MKALLATIALLFAASPALAITGHVCADQDLDAADSCPGGDGASWQATSTYAGAGLEAGDRFLIHLDVDEFTGPYDAVRWLGHLNDLAVTCVAAGGDGADLVLNCAGDGYWSLQMEFASSTPDAQGWIMMEVLPAAPNGLVEILTLEEIRVVDWVWGGTEDLFTLTTIEHISMTVSEHGDSRCLGDIDNDNVVGGSDLSYIGAYWNYQPTDPGWYDPTAQGLHVDANGNVLRGKDVDTDGSQVVGGDDLSVVGASWGNCP